MGFVFALKKSNQRENADKQEEKNCDRVPAPFLHLHQSDDERCDSNGKDAEASDIEGVMFSGHGRHAEIGQDKAYCCNGDIDPEHIMPA